MWEINEMLTWSFVIRGRWSTDWEEGQVYAILASRRIRDLAGALLLHFGKQYTPKKEMIQNLISLLACATIVYLVLEMSSILISINLYWIDFE